MFVKDGSQARDATESCQIIIIANRLVDGTPSGPIQCSVETVKLQLSLPFAVQIDTQEGCQ